jgi:hypothetical protein
MCVMSVIMEYGSRLTDREWNPMSYRTFQELLEAARKFDEAAHQPDCVDPNKAKLLEELGRKFENQS